VHRFPDLYQAEWLWIFRAKIGLLQAEDGDADLIQDLLTRMGTARADFTNTFRALPTGRARDQFVDPGAFDDWDARWQARRARDGSGTKAQTRLMNATNPAVIARNHRVETAIQASVSGDYTPFLKLNQVLSRPFDLEAQDQAFTSPPEPGEEVRQTFCGT